MLVGVSIAETCITLTIDEIQTLVLALLGARLFAGKVHVAGQLRHVLVHIKIEKLSVRKQVKVGLEPAKVWLSSRFGGRRNCVQVGYVLRHVGCPSAVVCRHIRLDNGSLDAMESNCSRLRDS